MAYEEAAFLAQAHPVFRIALERTLRDLQTLGWRPRIVHVRRTVEEQAEKVRKGYSKTMHSWHVDSTVGTLPTGAGEFEVVRGNAADIIDRRYGWGGVAANTDFQFWKDLGRIAKGHGCSWGGDWKSFKDVAHIQMLFIEMPPRRTVVA